MKAISSSSHRFTDEHLQKSSLPFLSWCYFSSNDLDKRHRWETLMSLDLARQAAVVGNDIFRNDRVEIFSDKEPIFLEACALIEKVWPDYIAVVNAMNPRFARTTSDDLFESASDPKTFGQILFNMKSTCPVKWAEIIVHELGHHYLNIILTTHSNQDVFNQPWGALGYSAIRNSERPLIGIYHGAFSQACMLTLACNILDTSGTEQYHQGAHRIFEMFEDKFQSDYHTIQSSGVITFDPHIQAFIESAVHRLDERRA